MSFIVAIDGTAGSGKGTISNIIDIVPNIIDKLPNGKYNILAYYNSSFNKKSNK